jgi:hypothetical protein
MPAKQLTRNTGKLLNSNIAIPQDHGSWVFLISPLLIGLFAAPNWSRATLLLIITSLAAFLVRQPITHIVKIYSKRRPKTDIKAAFFWVIVYTAVCVICILGLLYQGFSYIMLLALPGILVFAWYLFLISKRSERKQIGVEIVASGVLALSAPAAYWVGLGEPDPTGWVLFVLVWLQSAASIVYAYARLEQRRMKVKPGVAERFNIGKRALLYSSFNLIFVFILSTTERLPNLLPIPYIIQWVEVIWGTYNPAIRTKPAKIGLRQLIVSSLFTISFIFFWNI